MAEDDILYETRDDEIKEEQHSCSEGFKNWFKEFPLATWPILLTEFAERFSYYGIKTVLTLYLWQSLMYPKKEAKTIYHAFSMTSYFTGVIGAMIADSFLGKFLTVAISLGVYVIAEVVLTLTSLPSVGHGVKAGPVISLFVMAIACGNVKPCLAAFGGYQFDDQTKIRQLQIFFSMFYLSVNVGATLCMYFVPMIRTDFQCYGGDCYPLVFGVNTILIIIAFVAFVGGKFWFKIDKPEGNILIRVCKIIWHAISRRWNVGGGYHTHWLDYAHDKYEMSEIDDIKCLLRVLFLYIPLPFFWALFHQQGSSWVIQAEQMDGDLGSWGTLRSDQMQALNPILVIILIPLFDSVIYPILEKCNLPLSPLKKMTSGMVLGAISFFVCALVQIKIQTVADGPSLPTGSMTKVQFINAAPCDIIIDPESFFKVPIKYGSISEVIPGDSGDQFFMLDGSKCNLNQTFRTKLNLMKGQIHTAIIHRQQDVLTLSQVPMKIPDIDVNKAETRVRFFFVPPQGSDDSITVRLDGEVSQQFDVSSEISTRNYEKIQPGEYEVSFKSENTTFVVKMHSGKDKLKLGNFGAYTVVLQPTESFLSDKLEVIIFEDAAGTMVSRLLQIPQYVIMTAGEVMFAVTGLEFAYSQAPSSLKSVLQSFWLLTIAGGDLLVMLFTSVPTVNGVENEMFLYGGIMLIVCIIFALMAYFYKYADLEVTMGKHDGKNYSDINKNKPDDEETVC